MRVAIFSALLLFAALFAVWRGGAPERIVGIALTLAFGVSVGVQQPLASRFVSVEWGIFVADLALLFVLLAVALHADRFWTLWLVAFHALGTGGHLVRGLDHGIAPIAYAILLASWSYPMVLLLVIGTARHAERKRRLGRDRDWSRTLASGHVP